MSSTIKQAIQALKSRVADAFVAVEAKGGTLPQTQDSANLPAAIASIPSGGGSPYDELTQIGYTNEQIDFLKNILLNDVSNSLQTGTDAAYIGTLYSSNYPYKMLYATIWFYSYNRFYTVYYSGGSSNRLRFIFLNADVVGTSGTNGIYYCFNGCSNLEYIVGGVLDLTNMDGDTNGAFGNCVRLKEVRIKNLKRPLNISSCTNLSYASLLYLVQNLQNVSGLTLTIGSTNISKLNATAEGQAAIADAQAKGWNIA